MSQAEQINRKLLTACKLALHAFEHGWCIDWNELETAIKEAEKEIGEEGVYESEARFGRVECASDPTTG